MALCTSRAAFRRVLFDLCVSVVIRPFANCANRRRSVSGSASALRGNESPLDERLCRVRLQPRQSQQSACLRSARKVREWLLDAAVCSGSTNHYCAESPIGRSLLTPAQPARRSRQEVFEPVTEREQPKWPERSAPYVRER